MSVDLKEELKDKAEELGADLFGVASIADFEDAPPGHHPREILADAKSVIVLGMKLLDAQVNILPLEQEGASFFAKSPRQDMYAGHNTMVSRELDVVGFRLARTLEKRGFKAYHQMSSTGGVDNRFLTGLISLKHMAVKAGIGEFGYNSLVVTPQYGPRLRLSAIVTDAELAVDETIYNDFCGSCNGHPCVALCPSGALSIPEGDRPYSIDKFMCSTYLKTRPACTICMKVCPVGTDRVG